MLLESNEGFHVVAEAAEAARRLHLQNSISLTSSSWTLPCLS